MNLTAVVFSFNKCHQGEVATIVPQGDCHDRLYDLHTYLTEVRVLLKPATRFIVHTHHIF